MEQVKEAKKGCHMYMSVSDGGRLGNQMSQYATLIGQAHRLGFKPVISRAMQVRLGALFPYMTVVSDIQTKYVVELIASYLHNLCLFGCFSLHFVCLLS